MTYTKTIKAIDELIKLHVKQNEHLNNMKIALVIEKEFNIKEIGGKFLLINKLHYRKRYLLEYRQTYCKIQSYICSREKNDAKRDKDVTFIYDLENKRHIEVKGIQIKGDKQIISFK